MSTPKQPHVIPVRNAEFGFGFWPGRKGPLYELRERWAFAVHMLDGSYRHFVIPIGYLFNGASVPPCLWGAPWGYTPDGVYRAAALEHDFLCDLGQRGNVFMDMMVMDFGIVTVPDPVPHTVAHEHFKTKMREYGMRTSQVFFFANAVKLLGPRWKMPLDPGMLA